jgi:hypothetical protein
MGHKAEPPRWHGLGIPRVGDGESAETQQTREDRHATHQPKVNNRNVSITLPRRIFAGAPKQQQTNSKTMKKLYCLLGVAALLLPASSGFGQTPTPPGGIWGPFPGDHGPLSDTFTVYAPDGSIYTQYQLTEYHETTDGVKAIHVIPIQGLANPKNDLTKVLESPSDSWVGDVFGSFKLNVTLPNGTRVADWFLVITSDTETDQVPYASFATHTVYESAEPAGGWDETHNLAQSYRDQGYTAKFSSDSSVPEGGFTAGMLGFGLVGLGSLRRMAKR